MAQQLIASIYRINSNDTGAMGRIYGFPTQGIVITPTDVTTAAGVTMGSIIQVSPTGNNQPTRKYYSASTVATLITASNA